MKFLTNEWLNAAELDFKSANQLLQDESLTSVVTFHCQQTIEKLKNRCTNKKRLSRTFETTSFYCI